MTPRAHRQLLVLALFACLASCQARALSQEPPEPPHIEMADSFKVGELIRGKFSAPPIIEGAKEAIAWTLPPEIDFDTVDGGARVFGASMTPGKYTAKITRTITAPWPVKVGEEIQWRDFTLPPYEYSHVFAVTGVGPIPPPDPEPDPEPTPGTLGALVPNPAHRALLAEFYADMATEARNGTFKTIGHFRAAQSKSIADLKAAGRLPTTLSAINQPINDRLVAAVGLDDAPLDDAKKSALATALDSISAEFK